MALTVEDGSGVAGANSYASLADVRAFAAARGVTNFPADDTAAEAHVINAMDFLEGMGRKFKGDRASETQALQWPRQYCYIDGVLQPSNEIPQQLVNALCQLAIEAVGQDLIPNRGGRTVTLEKVDVIEVEYAARGATGDYPIFAKVLTFLRPLLVNGGRFANVRV